MSSRKRGSTGHLAVGLNLVFLAGRAGGAGRYVSELLPALLAAEPATRITAFVNREAPGRLFAEAWSTEIEWVRLPVTVTSPTHLLAQMVAIPAVAARRRLDLVHSPANVGPIVTPGVRRVVTLLDLIWLHHGEAWDTPRAQRSLRVLATACARTADRVIAISHAARSDLVSTLRLEPGKVDVAPLGVRLPTVEALPEPELRRRLGLGDVPVVLCVAQKRPYKNLSTLIRAIAELDHERPVLVLPGAPTFHEEELRSLARDVGAADRVRFLDWVSEQELEGLYRAAACFVLPSRIEGFGLPVLEAMARDVPVACSNRPALPEVAGDAALFFDPSDQTALAEAIRRLLRDRGLAAELVERGRARCRMFTWQRTAEATLASYRRAIEGRSADSG